MRTRFALIVIGAVFELYGGQAGGESRGGLRILSAVKFFMLQFGGDYSFQNNKWVEDVETLNELTPAYQGFKYRMSRYIKLAL